MHISAFFKQNAMKTFILSNNNGMNAEVTNYGGRIMRLMVPDRDGKMQDVVLGFDTAELLITIGAMQHGPGYAPDRIEGRLQEFR